MTSVGSQKDYFLSDGSFCLDGNIIPSTALALAYLTGAGFSLDEAGNYLKILILELTTTIIKEKADAL